MRAPSTARRGNLISAAGMVIAVVTTGVFSLVTTGATGSPGARSLLAPSSAVCSVFGKPAR
nr:NAD(P)(+) transhydrogenase (Re/Si-specific) subunit beta [Microbacterium endophyticum]